MESVAFIACIFVIAMGIFKFFSRLSIEIDALKNELHNARSRSDELEYALNDLVQNFGEHGLNFHCNTYQKLCSLSRARSTFGIIKNG